MSSDIALLLALILLNGLFAMSEIAILASRRVRLVRMSEDGNAGAARALELAAEPTRFMSSIQVGITTIGILSGAFGEARLAGPVRAWLEGIPWLGAHADALALALVVAGITYTSLILGELAPKRLAVVNPERVASLVSRPMQMVAAAARPIVYLLSVSTDGLLRLFGAAGARRPSITLDEIKALLQQGIEEGVLERAEQEMVANVLNLDERPVAAALTTASDIVFLDVRDPVEENARKLREHPHTVFPLCDGGLDHVVGFVRSTRVLEQLLENRALDVRALAEPPLFVPETITLMTLLEHFKRTRLPLALVVDEFGDVEGLVSLTDVIASIVGEVPEPGEEPRIVRREDGSALVDGALDLRTVARALGAEGLLEDEEREHYHTLGGFVMYTLGRVPRTGEVFERGGFRFEVVDMDGNRVDRVLISRRPWAAVGRSSRQ